MSDRFYYYFYKIKYHEDYEEGEKTITGIVSGYGLIDAMSNLLKMYEEESIITIKAFKPLTDMHCLEIEDKYVADYLSKIENF